LEREKKGKSGNKRPTVTDILQVFQDLYISASPILPGLDPRTDGVHDRHGR